MRAKAIKLGLECCRYSARTSSRHSNSITRGFFTLIILLECLELVQAEYLSGSASGLVTRR